MFNLGCNVYVYSSLYFKPLLSKAFKDLQDLVLGWILINNQFINIYGLAHNTC